ncbi:MAG: hypothetical protein LBU36_04530 [Clostridiales bacterium]|nr:hypothetical protein [Clostridiales bacterium]
MVTLKCDICHKEFLTHDDKEQFIVCDDCQQTALDELSDGKGEGENE